MCITSFLENMNNNAYNNTFHPQISSRSFPIYLYGWLLEIFLSRGNVFIIIVLIKLLAFM